MNGTKNGVPLPFCLNFAKDKLNTNYTKIHGSAHRYYADVIDIKSFSVKTKNNIIAISTKFKRCKNTGKKQIFKCHRKKKILGGEKTGGNKMIY